MRGRWCQGSRTTSTFRCLAIWQSACGRWRLGGMLRSSHSIRTMVPQIPQLYANRTASSGEPPPVLKGLTHIEGSPGETSHVCLPLSREPSSYLRSRKDGQSRTGPSA
ncbi:hypothetical protein BD626DRAFT_628344 [Schizophyllum amplum]|uniref:Uncharacterized protein n=1 Tax=Schizophyllum amplum TaxID=97359 RepID=A0A550CNN3_9AGAR|nr:hypothetical protein BD626DRAFT_628344 [Auriculariopsis ampla]